MARDLRSRLWRSLCEIDGVDEGSSVFTDADLARRRRFH
jgi:hypothetical protein